MTAGTPVLAHTPVGSFVNRATVGPRSHLALFKPARTRWNEAPGISADALASLAKHLQLSPQGRTDAFLLVHDGRLVFEWYRPEGILSAAIGPNTTQSAAAAAKGLIGSLLLGLALSDGVVHLDDRAATYIPAWTRDSLRSRITIRQLASHSSGLEDVSFYSDTLAPGWKRDYYRHPERRFEMAQRMAAVIYDPGTESRYSGLGYYVLAYVLAKAYANHNVHDIRELLQTRVMEPIGVAPKDWSISYGDSYSWEGLKLYAIGSGADITPRAAAKIAQLMLQNGSWEGRQLLSPDVVRRLTTEPALAAATPSDGSRFVPALGWWMNCNGTLPSVPRDAFAAIGGGHEIVLVIPSLKIIAVRFGSTLGNTESNPAFTADIETLFARPLIESLAQFGLGGSSLLGRSP